MTTEFDAVDAAIFALRSEAARYPSDARQRVFARLAESVPALASATGAAVVASKVASASGPSAIHVSLPAKPWLLGVFALGAAVGAGTFATLDPEPESRVVYVDRFVQAPQPKATEPVVAPLRASVPWLGPSAARPSTTPNARPATARVEPSRTASASPIVPPVEPDPPAAEAPNVANLAEQQALLDEARLALGKGDGQAALELLELHVRRHPASVLTEEREALTIKALARLGRIADARRKLDLFEKNFWRSPLIPSLEMATGRGMTETSR